MAVTAIKLQKEKASLKDGKYGCTREYLVTFDVANAGIFAAMTASIDGGPAIPAYGSAHPDNGIIRVTSLDAELLSDSLKHYKVTVEYTANEANQAADDPLQRDPEISYSFADSTESYFKDTTGKPVTNSAGEPFEQFLERETGELGITIVRNEISYAPGMAVNWAHVVNDSAVVVDGTNYVAGTLKLSGITAVKSKETYTDEHGDPVTVTYYRKTYTLRARRSGWKQKPLDTGLNQTRQRSIPTMTGTTPGPIELVPIMDSTGNPVKKPYPLDGQGKKKPNSTDEPAELEFKPYREMAFGALNLPT